MKERGPRDFGHLMARLRDRHGAPDLLADLTQTADADQRSAREWTTFVRRAVPHLARAPEDWTSDRVLLQLGLEEDGRSAVHAAAAAWLREHPGVGPVACRLTPAADSDTPLVGFFDVGAPVRGAAWLSTGHVVVWADRRVRVLDLSTGAVVHAWEHQDIVEKVRELPVGIVSAGYDGVLRVWDAATNAEQVVPICDDQPVLSIAPWRDQGLVAGDLTGELYLWRRGEETSASLDRWTYAEALWNDSAFTVLGDLLVHVSQNDILAVRLNEGAEARLEGHTAFVRGLVALDERRVLSWSDDRTLRLWDVRSRVALSVLTGPTDLVLGAAPCPGGGFLTWSADRTVRLWSPGGEEEVVLEHDDRPTRARPIGDSIAVLTPTRVHLWRRSGEGAAWPLHQPVDVAPLAGGRIAMAGRDPSIYIADPGSTALRRWSGHAGPVIALTASPDGTTFLSGSEDGTLRLWRDDVGATSADSGPSGAIQDVRVLSDDHVLVGRATGRVARIAVATGAEVWAADLGERSGLAVAGDRLVAWSYRQVTVLDLRDGALVGERVSPPAGPTIVAPDLTALTWSQAAGIEEALVWRLETGEAIATLRAPGEAWLGARFLSAGDAVLWTESGALFRWRGGDGALPLPLGQVRVKDLVVAGSALCVVGEAGELLVAAAADRAPRLLAEGVQGGRSAPDGPVFWTNDGVLLFGSASGERIEHKVAGKGDAPNWVGLASRGVVAVHHDGVLRYASRSTAAEVHDVPVQIDVAAGNDDETVLAVVRRSGVDLLDLPSTKRIARWQSDGDVRVHHVTRDGRVIATTAVGSVVALELRPARQAEPGAARRG